MAGIALAGVRYDRWIRFRLPLMGILVPLDKTGNSVKGQLVAGFLSRRLGMDLFVSAPED
jgi:hypothetical protein